jgi:hypothetical protein
VICPQLSVCDEWGPGKDVYSSISSRGDYHSTQTRRRWCSHIARLPWVTTDNVNEGGRRLNFGDWEALEEHEQANDHLIGISEETKQKGTPPFSYRMVNGRLSLNPSEIGSLCSWSLAFRKYPVVPARIP